MRNCFLKNIFNRKTKLLFVILFLFFAKTYGQNFSATAKIDTNEMLIGKQVKLTLILTHEKNHNIPWIEIPDSLGKIEIIEKSRIDLSYSPDSSSILRKQQLVLTCFVSGYFVIPPFRFTNTSNSDTITNFAETLPLLLNVYTIPVDTTQAIKDIKAPVSVPLSWKDILPWLLGFWAMAGIILAAYFLYKKYKKKPVVTEIQKPARPAHEIALEELKKLEAEKLWQQGNFKYYYTRLTDIIRIYLWHRYDVNAMEMTTDEILNSHSIKQLNREIFLKLKFILELADLVKFAKVIPVANENEQCISNAYEFIRVTKLVEIKKSEEVEVPT